MLETLKGNECTDNYQKRTVGARNVGKFAQKYLWVNWISVALMGEKPSTIEGALLIATRFSESECL